MIPETPVGGGSDGDDGERGHSDSSDNDDDETSTGDDDQSEGESDDEVARAAAKPPRGSSSSGCAARPSRRKESAKPPDFRNLSDGGWDVRQHRDGSDFASMKWTKTGEEYTVAYNRVAKAQLHLTPDSFLEPMREDACTCRGGKCCRVLSIAAIKEIRTQVYTQCHDEKGVADYIFGKLRANPGRIQLNNEDVCRTYYAKVHSVGARRITHLKKVAGGWKLLASRTATRKRVAREARTPQKSEAAYAFWYMFFDSNCQRPNDEVRLFPVYETFPLIFKEYFKPWFARLVKKGMYTEAARPKFGTFKAARRHADFKDVVDRPKHYHARCETCRNLSDLLLNAFADGAAEEDYKRQRDLHDAAVHAWRKYESVTEAQALSHPDQVSFGYILLPSPITLLSSGRARVIFVFTCLKGYAAQVRRHPKAGTPPHGPPDRQEPALLPLRRRPVARP